MQTRLNLDKLKYQLFIQENRDWQHVLKAQAGEIPGWDSKLAEVKAAPENINTAIDEEKVAIYFSLQLTQQQNKMVQLNEAIEVQQKRLETDCSGNPVFDIDAFCTQDILRERIKEIEKKFIDLKCSFMRYFSTAV